ncbi:phosphotransferase [Streptomyces decoyicus]|uniref:phosphotransferase n=1 Tax=Streptomyces decoyicus TaxID=249567 RepID=UPI003C12C5D7
MEWASCVAGTLTKVRGAASSSNSPVWELFCRNGSRIFVKVASSEIFHVREVHAYRFAVPALGPLCAPRLMASDPAQLAVLLTAAPGRNVATTRVTMADRVKVHHQAGWLLHALHSSAGVSIGASVDPGGLLRARRRSIEEHLAAAGDLLSPAERELVRRLATLLPLLSSCPVAFIHGDAQERNLLWDAATGSVTLLDFGRAQPALAVDDFVRLATGPWASPAPSSHCVLYWLRAGADATGEAGSACSCRTGRCQRSGLRSSHRRRRRHRSCPHDAEVAKPRGGHVKASS